MSPLLALKEQTLAITINACIPRHRCSVLPMKGALVAPIIRRRQTFPTLTGSPFFSLYRSTPILCVVSPLHFFLGRFFLNSLSQNLGPWCLSANFAKKECGVKLTASALPTDFCPATENMNTPPRFAQCEWCWCYYGGTYRVATKCETICLSVFVYVR